MSELVTDKYYIQIDKVEKSRLPETDLNNIPFGKVFTDHMFQADYYDGAWRDARIGPFSKLEFSPAISALHYGQSLFEGMKANRDREGNVLLFRTDMNFRRINRSCDRMAIPKIPEEIFMSGLRELLNLDRDWIPTKPGSALYIRPFVFSTMEYVGIKPSDRFKFIIFCSPVGPYYSRPVRVLVADHYVRAFRGGTGFAKAAGNYGATLKPMAEAQKAGYDQVLWMDGVHFEYIHEIGTMNVFFQIGDSVVTPSTDTGEILEGVTRDSAIRLLRDNGYRVEERQVSITEVVQAYEAGELRDAFGTGTAAAIAQISVLGYKGRDLVLPDPQTREVSNFLREELIGIREGRKPDPYGWIEKI